MKLRWRIAFLVVLPALSATTFCLAQAKPATTAEYRTEPLVIEHLSTIYTIHADGTGEKTVRAVAHIQSEALARQYGVLNLSYAAGNESAAMHYVRVRKADGTVIETPGGDAQDMPAEVTRLAPFYSDLRQKQFPVRSLSVGDTLEYEGVIQTNKAQAILPNGEAEFWGAETFVKDAVILDEQIELRVPVGRSLIVVSPHLEPVTTTENAERVYRWHTSQLTPTVSPPDKAKDAPADIQKPANDGLPDIAWTSFKDWAAVGEWYRSLAADRAAVTPAIKTRATALTQGAATDEEKTRRIYAFVAADIRYIGVAFGIGRYQPHTAEEVLANQYGDCKDKHTLLASLLAAAGVQASPVLIGSGLKFDRDVPAPFSFNHVITAVDLPAVGTQPAHRVWLDSTAEVAPFGMLTAPTRDKDALLMPASGRPTLVKTPADLPFSAFDHWEARGTLDKDGKLTGHFDVTMRGDMELMMRWGLRQTTAAQWPELGQSLSNNFGFSGTVSHFTPASAEATGQPLHYSYDYERTTFGDWANHRILSLVPFAFFSLSQVDKQPAESINIGSPRVESARSTIHLPEGYTAKLPAAVHVQSSFAKYDLTYSAKNGDVLCETTLEIRSGTVPVAAWEEYNRFAKEVADNNQQYVQLHAAGDPVTADAAGETAQTSAAPSNSTDDVGASALLEEAWKLIQSHDIAGAEAKVDAARKLNPNQWGLWAMTGAVAYGKMRFEDAEADYAKELELHPNNEFALGLLAGTQIYRKERPQAIATLEKLNKLKPNEPGLIGQLAGLLTYEKRYPEALTLLQAAALKNPGNKQLILQLGRTQLAAGRTEEAVATLHTALEDTTDPLVLNDAAYELASHDADLALAEASARKALKALDAETQKFTLAEVTAPELGRASLVSATWDTLGWIEFKKGNATEAETLLRAAWATSQHPEVGYHLGRAFESLGKPQQAYESYREAQATMRDGASFSGSDDLPVRVAALEKDGAKARPLSDNKLGEERTYTLPLITKRQAGGDYYFLLSRGKVEAASWIEGDAELKDVEPKMASAVQTAVMAPSKPPLFPTDSDMKLVRRGVVSCSTLLHSCMVVLMLPQDARINPKLTKSIRADDGTQAGGSK